MAESYLPMEIQHHQLLFSVKDAIFDSEVSLSGGLFYDLCIGRIKRLSRGASSMICALGAVEYWFPVLGAQVLDPGA